MIYVCIDLDASVDDTLLCIGARRLNKNMVDGGSYITIGDLYKGNKIILPDRWKGKGFSVS